jgi:site-specific DNA-cytosine methylase
MPPEESWPNGGGQVAVFRKAQRAHHPDDCERWEATEQADTLDAIGHSPRTAHAVLDARGFGDGERATTITGDAERRITDHTNIVADPITAHEARTYTHEGCTFRLRNVVGTVPRRLTPKECERLQGFPDEWTLYGIDEVEPGVMSGEIKLSDSARYRCLGNAVTVNVVQWIADRLMCYENGDRESL